MHRFWIKDLLFLKNPLHRSLKYNVGFTLRTTSDMRCPISNKRTCFLDISASDILSYDDAYRMKIFVKI